MQVFLYCSSHHSPDYNPIEETFSYVKSYLRKHDTILQSISDPSSVVEMAFHSITPDQCSQWIAHSGYF
jgi:transposase